MQSLNVQPKKVIIKSNFKVGNVESGKKYETLNTKKIKTEVSSN